MHRVDYRFRLPSTGLVGCLVIAGVEPRRLQRRLLFGLENDWTALNF